MTDRKHYQVSDKSVIDYQLYNFNDLQLRGPKSSSENFIAYIGGAQTFGRFCQHPFPSIVGSRLNVGTLNFGRGGAGPAYFANSDMILNSVNQAKVAVIQIMSGRSVNNSVFFSLNHTGYGVRLIDGKEMKAIHVYKELANGRDPRGKDVDFIKNLVSESRQIYVDQMISLLKKIKPPKILLWLSVRHPKYEENYDARASQKEWIRSYLNNLIQTVSNGRSGFLRGYSPERNIYSDFPHLVNSEMLELIKPYCETYVECVTKVGLPQILVDGKGNKVGENKYYPSPEMHLSAAKVLYPICSKLL
jgi:hypothetical protein